MTDEFKDYRHAPTHLCVSGATYFLTGATLHHARLVNTDGKKRDWTTTFLHVVESVKWHTAAWVLLENHYHAMLIADEGGNVDIVEFIQRLHRQTAFAINKTDQTPGRKVWYNYWDRCITFEKSYWARVNYIHHNPVKHGYVQCAAEYPYGSYFDTCHEPETEHRENLYPWDAVSEHDEF